jgi:hypothetical protein
VPYGELPAGALLTLVDEFGVIGAARALPEAEPTRAQCSDWTFDTDYEVTQRARRVPVALSAPRFSQTLLVHGLRLTESARTVDPALIDWSAAPGRRPYMAVDADGDGTADVVTDTVYLTHAHKRAYDTWIRLSSCEDLAHGGWCRVAHEEIAICGDHG